MKKIIHLFLFCIVLNQTGFAQSAIDRQRIVENTNISRLEELSEQFQQSFNQNKSARAYKLTIQNNKEETGYFSGFDSKGDPVYDFNENKDAATTSRTNRIWAGGTTKLNLDGSGIQIGHWEAGGLALQEHEELKGRIVRGEYGDNSSHATHTACTMIGSGLNYRARGMASGATIIAYDSKEDEIELIDFASKGGILSNHSYGTGNPDGELQEYGVYTDNSAEWDEILYNAPYLLICKSAGNDRNDEVNQFDDGYDILFTVCVSKNLLTIGAVDDVKEYTTPELIIMPDFSSWGPTDDWRIKPDIMANGVDIFSADDDNNNDYKNASGTSMASAVVTGNIALLQQHYHNNNNIYMKSATAKALVIASADELGLFDGPDFQNGWGLLNTERAAEIITKNGATTLIQELSLENNTTYSSEIEVDGNSPLSITMVWTDPAGIPLGGHDNLSPMLVNDLDIRLSGNDETFLPWVMVPNFTSFKYAAEKGDNSRDNIEKIEIKEIPAGKYSIKVSHKGELKNEIQNFSLVINGILGNPVSVQELTNKDKIKVFPNPTTNDEITISIPDKNGLNQFTLQLYNSKGQLLRNKKYTKNTIRLNVSSLNKGVYFIKIQKQQKVYTRQIIIN